MGLSDEERISKIYWAITHITEILRDFNLDEDTRLDLPYEQDGKIRALQEQGDKLWHQFLGSKSNGAFWILGGDAGNGVKDAKGGPWSAAICSLCDEHRENPNVLRLGERKEFDPFNGYLDVGGLLNTSGLEAREIRAGVYNVYGNLEFLMYALRRYQDGLLTNLKELSHTLSTMMGLCFTIFARDEIYGRAYVLNRILEAIYGGRFGYEDDPLGQVLNKMNFQHDLNRPMGRDGSLKEIIDWDWWRLTHKNTPQNRLILALRIAGRRFHYEHNFKDLTERTQGMGIRKRVLTREFKKCVEAHDEMAQKNQNQYKERKNMSEDYAIHGFRRETS